MNTLKHTWRADGADQALLMNFVEGTKGRAFSFGERPGSRDIQIADFFMSTVPVTQALWTHVMGADTNLSHFRGDGRPVENVSWNDVTGRGGFLDRINAGDIHADIARQLPEGFEARFRLPSETEWEYAARGGTRWADGFQFSGSNDIDSVAWYDRVSSGSRVERSRSNRPRSNHLLGTETHDVAMKMANQLGLFDMCGNVWEWCQDCFTDDISAIPADGTPFLGEGSDRVLRGGCHHNWAIHCTVHKRYAIVAEHRDECVGFRLALGDS